MLQNIFNDEELGFEEEQLANHIANEVVARASGQNFTECTLNYPRDVFFIGNIRPAHPAEDGEEQNFIFQASEFFNKLSPVAFGVEFLLEEQQNSFEVRVGLTWSCYYRVFPTFEQQLAYQRRDLFETLNVESSDSLEEDEASNEPDNRRGERTNRDSLFIKFRKINCYVEGLVSIHIRESNANWDIDASDFEENTRAEIARATQVAQADPDILRTNSDSARNIRVSDELLEDATGSQYLEYISSLVNPIMPEWEWVVNVIQKPFHQQVDSNSQTLFFEFTNTSSVDDNHVNLEPFFFEVEAKFIFIGGNVRPFTFDLAPRGFRYDLSRFYSGKGFNCNVEQIVGDLNWHYRTANVPRHKQLRYQTRNEPVARFEDLSRDPIPVLENILVSMNDYLVIWRQWEQNYQNEAWWNNEYQTEFELGLEKFVGEIERFSIGIDLIRENPDILYAFILTNETFNRSPKEAWRLFQIVFLVSQIPSVFALNSDSGAAFDEEREFVDIIYFPTGGGKTEAYLSLIVFQCFCDRLRGKTAGVSVWTRFPLRLLTLQQTQRAADIIGLADLVRREQDDGRLVGSNITGFGVGYYVGASSTPNKLIPPFSGDAPNADWEIALDRNLRQEWKRVIQCPSCRTNSIVLDFDEDAIRLRHRCTNSACAFPNGIIPVYVVDYEIYRYLPAVIIGTIDKLASVGLQQRMSMIFGNIDGYCSVHGYYLGKCVQDNCRDRNLLNTKVPEGISGPTLFVQDELHLLKEGLGTFDGHYETFTQQLQREFGQVETLKIIASSATIEAFERQVEHLYGRPQNRSRVFPGLGPTLSESFYAYTLSYPQRLFFGIIPHNKTLLNAVLEIVQYYHEAIQSLQNLGDEDANPYGGAILPGTQEWTELLDYYMTSLTYFLSTRDLHSVKTDLEGHVNGELTEGGFQEIAIDELTGSVSSSRVASILEKLERLVSNPLRIDDPSPDAILATSMISHGVDIDRLNGMLFYGMPRQMAEYIQSSSRVGRSHVGSIFVCMHPARERDRSHFSYFPKFHQFLGQLIEPVAINRWSQFSIDRTLPGLFMAIMLQIISSQNPEVSRGQFTRLDFIKQRIRSGNLTQDQFIPILEQAFKVDNPSSPGGIAFRQKITQRVNQYFDQIIAAAPNKQWVSEALIPPPMTSLRDVDEQLDLILDDNGSIWINRGR